MIRILLTPKLYFVLVLFLLSACGSILVIPDKTVESLDQFPEESVVIETRLKEHHFQMWVADTPPRRAQGLMSVRSLEDSRGMLFLYNSPTRVVMWMKDMVIPIDILFITADGRVLSMKRYVRPSTLQPIQATEPISAVIELPGGTATRLNLKNGDIVRNRHFASLTR